MKINTINFFVKNSLPEFQGVCIVRSISRHIYHLLAERSIEKIEYATSQNWSNTYPWPYSDPELFCMAVDPSGFIVRSSMSYCAWKIRELTGVWLRRPKDEMDTSDIGWNDELFCLTNILADNGYSDVESIPRNLHQYVGIEKAKSGERVVWFHHIDKTDNLVYCSAYVNHRFCYIPAVGAELFNWIVIN